MSAKGGREVCLISSLVQIAPHACNLLWYCCISKNAILAGSTLCGHTNKTTYVLM